MLGSIVPVLLGMLQTSIQVPVVCLTFLQRPGTASMSAPFADIMQGSLHPDAPRRYRLQIVCKKKDCCCCCCCTTTTTIATAIKKNNKNDTATCDHYCSYSFADVPLRQQENGEAVEVGVSMHQFFGVWPDSVTLGGR